MAPAEIVFRTDEKMVVPNSTTIRVEEIRGTAVAAPLTIDVDEDGTTNIWANVPSEDNDEITDREYTEDLDPGQKKDFTRLETILTGIRTITSLAIKPEKKTRK